MNENNPVKEFFAEVGGWFGDIGKAIAKGDIFTKLSILIMGAQNFRSKQIVRGIIMTLVEVAFILYTAFIGVGFMSKLNTLGTVERAVVYNAVTMKNETNNYDHSFKILLFGMISVIIIVAFVVFWLNNIRESYKLELMRKEGKHINTFKDDLHALINEKFYKTLLFLPCTGVIVFTIVPLIVMIAVAFTNYDKSHLPPSSLLSWVGFENFAKLFGSSLTSTFGYSFRMVLLWTIIWAFFATFTTYFGGILLSLLINGPKIKLKKMWRTLFIIAIAVPQFVTLLLVRQFFADDGIVNTICGNVGITQFLTNIGLVRQGLNYIPFLSSPNWAKVMIILINIWVGVPYQMLIATGVLMNIPEELIEAARIDGANKFQTFKSITMPYMLAVTGPSLVTAFVANINNFNVIYLLTTNYTTMNQKLANSSAKEVDLLVTWLFRLTQDEYNYKMASVIGIMVFVICAIFTLVAFNKVTHGKEGDFQ